MTETKKGANPAPSLKNNGWSAFIRAERAVRATGLKLSRLILFLADYKTAPSIKTIGRYMKKTRSSSSEPDPRVLETGSMHAVSGQGIGSSFSGAVAALARGGKVPGRSAHARADNILARLTAGEWVIQKPSVEYYGAQVMNAINKRLIDKKFLLNAAAGSFRQRINQAIPEALNTVRKTVTAPPSFAFGGSVSSGSPFPDYNYLRYLNAMDELAFQNEKIAAKAADAARMQELAAERWGGILGSMNSAGFGNGMTALGTINISLNGTSISDPEFERQLTRVLKRTQMRR